MCSACACNSSGKDLSSLGDVLTQCSCVLVINCAVLSAEYANFSLSVEISLASEGLIAIISIESHDFLLIRFLKKRSL